MIILLIFAFIAGVVTILSPCILPILPVVLSGSVGSGKKKPFGVVAGFVLSFTFFTLFLSLIVQATGIPADVMRVVSVVIILTFGISLLIPQFQVLLERVFSKMSQYMPKGQQKDGFTGGLLVGLSLGLIWTPCVGPILASVISLALAGSVTGTAALITFAYSLGTAIPMFAIMYGGRQLFQKVPWLLQNTDKIQKAFGVLMIVTAVAIFFQFDRKFQTFVLQVFPQYGVGLTAIEDNEAVRKELDNLKQSGSDSDSPVRGKPLDEMTQSGYPLAPELRSEGRWYNLPTDSIDATNEQGIKLESLRGRVVMVKFWTYTCINCIRTLPYVREWYTKYEDDGFVIIGVHTPEFEFEKDPENVRQAIADFQLTFPVVQDNNFKTWRAYNNRYWPATYLIDKDGRIRYTHFGEGKYEETEQMIRELLEEKGTSVEDDVSRLESNLPNYNRTHETYLGYGRIERFASPEEIVQEQSSRYTIPNDLPQDTFAYAGQWTIGEEYAMAQQGSQMRLRFQAKEVYVVMRSAEPEPGEVRVLLDGEPISPVNAGADVMEGTVTVTKDTIYHIVNYDEPREGVLQLEFLDPNTEIYAFTFG